MTLIICPECSGKVSTESEFCPHCGAPNELEMEEWDIDDVDPEGKGAISRRYSESAVDLYGRIAELRINVPQELRLCRGRVDEDSGQDE